RRGLLLALVGLGLGRTSRLALGGKGLLGNQRGAHGLGHLIVRELDGSGLGLALGGGLRLRCSLGLGGRLRLRGSLLGGGLLRLGRLLLALLDVLLFLLLLVVGEAQVGVEAQQVGVQVEVVVGGAPELVGRALRTLTSGREEDEVDRVFGVATVHAQRGGQLLHQEVPCVVVELALLGGQGPQLGEDRKSLHHLAQSVQAAGGHALHVGARALLPVQDRLVGVRAQEVEEGVGI